MRRRIHNFLWSLLLLPFLSGCTSSDDIQAIFTGKTWRLTYITQGKGAAWYGFPGLTDSDYKAYDPNTGTKQFTIEFTGAEHDHVISGGFTCLGSLRGPGTWSANGESKAFNAQFSSTPTVDKNDKLAAIIRDALSKANEYSGDEMNLFIHFTYEKERLFMAFSPVK